MNIELPPAAGEPLMQAQIKLAATDFIVREQLDFDFEGAGEHLYLYIRKCELNTHDVTQQLQRLFACQSVDVGVSGLKDKRAVTEQWFSVRTPKSLSEVDIAVCNAQQNRKEGSVDVVQAGTFEVLKSYRHSRKLRRGAHRFNLFTILIRQIAPMSNIAEQQLPALLQQRLELVEQQGFANYFGPQRFGRNGQNLVKAERLFACRNRKISRTQRGLFISAARSQLFNLVCAERIRQASWSSPMLGEPMLLDGSNSYFLHTQDSDDVTKRCDLHDIHPSGPLWGRGNSLAEDECKSLEQATLQPYKNFTNGLESAGLEQQRRALRTHVHGLRSQWISDDAVKLDFKLLKGAYATSFLSEFMINY